MSADPVAPAGSAIPLCVIGLGQIGGSLLRAAASHRPVFGTSRSEHTREAARAAGFDVVDSLTDTLDRARSEDALVVLATPVPTFGDLLETINRRAPRIRLTDVGSIKGIVDSQVRELAPEARFVGSHPMCGTQYSGWESASATLFQDRVWVTCLTDTTDLDDWFAVARLALEVGSRVVPADPEQHDDAVARISHLPHLLALALAQVGAAGSFADGTRVAATRQDLIREMTEPNQAALVGAADELLGLLGVARGSLASSGSLRNLAEHGHRARQAFERRSENLVSFRISGEDLAEELLAVGAAGGHVYGIDDSAGEPELLVRYPDEIEEPSAG